MNTRIFWIDLFAGAGGTTTGIERTGGRVLACVNHDVNAIQSHMANHKDVIHFTEDVRDLKVIENIKKLVKKTRKLYPNCIINLWASLECTNFSNAKGGKAKDADSRSLAEIIPVYQKAINPNNIWIENVREFMSWGPLDKNNKPIHKLKGKDYKRWVNKICKKGYDFEYKLLNSADFGAYTSRIRFFGQFVTKGSNFKWPTPTHNKKGINNLPKWKAVRNILDLEDVGNSIFNRKTPLVENTLKKIHAGLQMHTENFLIKYYSTGKNAVSIDVPSPTIGTKDTCAKINFMMMHYGNGNTRSLDKPAATVLANDKHNLTTVLLYNPQWGGSFRNINRPCHTIIARMDKAPPYVTTALYKQNPNIIIKKTDSRYTKRIKGFMIRNNIADISMRMLNIPELLQIQGFPKNYILKGTKSEQKKYIGNAVEVNMSAALTTYA